MKERYRSYKRQKFLKLTMITITTLLLSVSAFTAGGMIRRAQWTSEKRKAFENFFIGKDKEVEYGTEISIVDLQRQMLKVDLSMENVKIDINGEEQPSDRVYKFLKINDNKIKCTLTEAVEGEKISVARTYIYKVIDTVKPKLEGIADKEITVGQEIDLKEGIVATDPIDGNLEVETSGDFNKDASGEYTITVKAKDKNNNEASSNFKVTVKEKPAEVQQANNTNASNKDNKKQSTSNNNGNTQNNNSNNDNNNNSNNNNNNNQSSGSSSSGNNSGSNNQGSGSSTTPSTPSTPSTQTDTFVYKSLPSNASSTFSLVNQKRTDAGVNALTWDSGLAKVAEARAMDLAKTGTFSHTTPNLGTPAQTMAKYGYSYSSLAENLAGNSTNTGAVNAWMNSSGHRTNMLNAKYKKTGIGVVTSPKYGKIYCQIFTN